MKNLLFILITYCIISSCNQTERKQVGHHEHGTEKPSANGTSVKSPHKSAMANVGDVHVHLEYNSPSVRNRLIWGGLVPYGEVWVTGAHMATSIHFYGDVIISGTRISEGKYGFFTIPGEDEWTLILNKNWEQHLTDDYETKDDVLRWSIKPDIVENTEALTYMVTGGEEKGSIEFRWEKIKFSFDILAAE